MRAFTFLPLLAICTSATADSDTTAARVMPLGDSITQWICGPLAPGSPDAAGFGGYREPLGRTLKQRGVVFDFVGTCLVEVALVRFPPILQTTLALHKFTIMGIGQLLVLMLPQKRT